MKNNLNFAFIFILILGSFSVRAQGLKFQLGLELGKYIRNFSSMNHIPFEVVAVAKHKENIRIYPRISLGYGDFTKERSNYKVQTDGYYIKPGVEFYFGNKQGIINGVIAANLIFGKYNANNQISIENPVWGNAIFNEKFKNKTLNGIEGSYGIAMFIKKRFEYKMLLGLRGITGENQFSRQSKGVIPGFGYGKDGYRLSSFCTIILSYKL